MASNSIIPKTHSLQIATHGVTLGKYQLVPCKFNDIDFNKIAYEGTGTSGGSLYDPIEVPCAHTFEINYETDFYGGRRAKTITSLAAVESLAAPGVHFPLIPMFQAAGYVTSFANGTTDAKISYFGIVQSLTPNDSATPMSILGANIDGVQHTGTITLDFEIDAPAGKPITVSWKGMGKHTQTSFHATTISCFPATISIGNTQYGNKLIGGNGLISIYATDGNGACLSVSSSKILISGDLASWNYKQNNQLTMADDWAEKYCKSACEITGCAPTFTFSTKVRKDRKPDIYRMIENYMLAPAEERPRIRYHMSAGKQAWNNFEMWGSGYVTGFSRVDKGDFAYFDVTVKFYGLDLEANAVNKGVKTFKINRTAK